MQFHPNIKPNVYSVGTIMFIRIRLKGTPAYANATFLSVCSFILRNVNPGPFIFSSTCMRKPDA